MQSPEIIGVDLEGWKDENKIKPTDQQEDSQEKEAENSLDERENKRKPPECEKKRNAKRIRLERLGKNSEKK